MTETWEDPSSADGADEDRTVRLLRLADARPAMPDVRAARVRSAVRQRWQIGTRRRVVRRRILSGAAILAAAAGVVLFAGRTMLDDRHRAQTEPGDVVAAVERIEGTPRHIANDASPGAPGYLSLDKTVRTGEAIETDAMARVALRFTDGTSVRLDAGSRVRLLSGRAIELSSGAVYVDSGRTPGQFEVRTAVATARDVGTQFEVRLSADGLRLRVRTGLVELSDGVRNVSGRSGTEVTFSAGGAVSRPIATHGPDWAWTATLAPPLEIEGLALSTFLERVAHEQGWQLQYTDAAIAAEASGIILHGSVRGLQPREAVEIMITTSGLQHRIDDGELIVSKGSRATTPGRH